MNYKYFNLPIDLTTRNTETKTIKIPFKVNEENILFGFKKFQIGYGSKDHHVRDIKMKMALSYVSYNASENATTVKIDYRADINDDSGHHMDDGKLEIVVVAHDVTGAEELETITALQSFDVGFDEDHHVFAYAVTRPNTYITDINHHISYGNSVFKDYCVPSEVLKKMRDDKAFICAGFTISAEDDDSHVKETGLTIEDDGSVDYKLVDKKKNHAYKPLCNCEYNTYVDGNKNSYVSQLFRMSLSGKQKDKKGNADVLNIAESHVQGILRYGNYYICSHNNKGYSKGHMVIIGENDYQDIETSIEHFNHPSGIQRMDDYMIMGIENSEHSRSYVYLYNIAGLSLSNLPKRIENFEIYRKNAGTTATGICKDESRKKYIVAAYDMHKSDNNTDGSTFDFYEIGYKDGEDLKSKQVKLSSPSYSIKKDFSDCQNISLYYDPIVKKNYLVAFTTTSEGLSYKDCMEVYELLVDERKLKSVAKFHLKTDHGAIIGIDGVHVRWGASQDIVFENGVAKPHVITCSRNFVAKNLTINIF